MSSFRRFLSRPFGWLIAVAGFLCMAVPLAWATMVIYYSNLPWAVVRIGLAAAFAAFAIWALWFSRQRSMSVLAVVLFSVSWSGGSPSVPRTIATGDRKSPSCRAPRSMAITCT